MMRHGYDCSSSPLAQEEELWLRRMPRDKRHDTAMWSQTGRQCGIDDGSGGVWRFRLLLLVQKMKQSDSESPRLTIKLLFRAFSPV